MEKLKLSANTPLMDVLGYLNPYAATPKDVVEFRTVRENNKRNGDTFVMIPGVSRIMVPKILENEFVYQPDGKTMVMEEAVIAYVPGAQSIFASEIISTKSCKDLQEVFSRAQDILIYDGTEIIQGHEINRIAFLRATSNNKDSKSAKGTALFYEYDKNALAKQFLANEAPKIKVVAKVQQWIDDNREISLWAMFANLQNLTVGEAMSRYSYEQVKAEMLYRAKWTPEVIEKMANDKKEIDRIFVIMAIHDKYYDELSDGSVYDKGGVLIARKGQGGSVIDAILAQIQEDQLKDLRVDMAENFKSHANKFDSQSKEIEKLRKQNALLEQKLSLAGKISSKDLIAASKGAPTDEQVQHLVDSWLDAELITRNIKWLKGAVMPPDEVHPSGTGKAWDIEILTRYYQANPAEFWVAYEKYAVVDSEQD